MLIFSTFWGECEKLSSGASIYGSKSRRDLSESHHFRLCVRAPPCFEQNVDSEIRPTGYGYDYLDLIDNRAGWGEGRENPPSNACIL